MNSGLKTLVIVLLVSALAGGTVYYVMLQREQKAELEKLEQQKMIEEENEKMEKEEEKAHAEKEKEREAFEEKAEEVEPNEATIPEGDFTKDADGNYLGTIYLEGYAITELRPEAFCDPTVDDCLNYEYMVFNYMNVENADFLEMIADSQGNSFVGQGSVGIGCLTYEGTIEYMNAADEDSGGREFVWEGDDIDKLISATEDRPVVLKMSRKLFTGGSGAPTCYSHFRDFEVYELQ
ncbi:hypothetical protein ACFL21_01060 [Patescibacteria group bacterium]